MPERRSTDSPTLGALISRVETFLLKNVPPLSGKQLTLFVSGGPDSMFLLHVMGVLFGNNSRLSVVTINYQLREEDSLLDQKLVESTCAGLGIPVRVITPGSPSSEEPKNTQAWARSIRLKAMKELLKKREADYFFTAHHRDDFLETFFIKLSQGASPAAFGSLTPVSDKIIRPLFFLSKQEILQGLDEAKLPYRVDHTNGETHYLRNRFRNVLFPQLDQTLPDWRGSFFDSLQSLARNADFLKSLTQKSPWFGQWKKHSFYIRKSFFKLPGARSKLLLQTALRSYFPKKRFSAGEYGFVLHKILNHKFGPLFRYQNREVVYDHGLIGHFHKYSFSPVSLTVGVKVNLESQISLQLQVLAPEEDPGYLRRRQPETFYFSLPQPGAVLSVRGRLSGDRFHPLGLAGGAKPVNLKDWLISHHIPRFLRPCALVYEYKGVILGVSIPPFFLPGEMKKVLCLKWVSRDFAVDALPYPHQIILSKTPHPV